MLIFDWKSLRQVSEWRGADNSAYVTSLVAADDRNNVLTFAGTRYGELFLHASNSRQQIEGSIPAHPGEVAALCVAASQTGTCVISGGRDDFIRFWTLQLDSLGQIEVETPICGLALAGNDRLVVGTERGVMMLRLDWELILSSVDRTGLNVTT